MHSNTQSDKKQLHQWIKTLYKEIDQSRFPKKRKFTEVFDPENVFLPALQDEVPEAWHELGQRIIDKARCRKLSDNRPLLKDLDGYFKEISIVIAASDDLDLPSQLEMVAEKRCNSVYEEV